MSKSKRPTGGKHKPRRMVGIPARIAIALEQLAERRATNLTEYVKSLCVTHLTEQGMWPPPSSK